MSGWTMVVTALLLSATAPGDTVTVKREGARLMKAPRFFGAACDAAVAPGTRVKLLEVRQGWARLATPGGGACWLHETAWKDRTAGGLAAAGGKTSSRDVELAGRGFSEGEEARYKGEHPDLGAAFRALDAHLARGAESTPAEVARFMADGQIGGGP